MLSLSQKTMLYAGIQQVQEKRRAQADQAAQQAASERTAVMGAKLQVATSHAMGPKVQGKPGAGTGAKKPAAGAKAAGAKKPAAKSSTKVPASTITPYLTATDLMGVSAAKAQQENTDSAARNSLDTATADAFRASGDVNRATVRNVSDANNDAAARGIYRSGIRAGNVGQAQAQGARGIAAIQGSLGLAAAQSIAARAAAKSQLGDFMTAMTAKAAENGAALPVDPYSGKGSNVPGAATLKKRKA